jgi:hypothetical protein
MKFASYALRTTTTRRQLDGAQRNVSGTAMPAVRAAAIWTSLLAWVF